MDVLSGVGLMLIKPIAKSKMSLLKKNQQILNYQFVVNATEVGNFLWFDKDVKAIQAILDENQQILKNYDSQEMDLRVLNSISSFTSKPKV